MAARSAPCVHLNSYPPRNFVPEPAFDISREFPLATAVSFHSYMDTEQYEDAVRDYEKVYQTEKTKGERISTLVVCKVNCRFSSLLLLFAFISFPTIRSDLQPLTPARQC